MTIFDFPYASPNSFVLRIPLVTFLRSIVADLLAFLLLLLFVASLVIYQYLDPPPPSSDWPLLLANWGHQLQNFCDIIFSCVFRSICVQTWNHLPDLFFFPFSSSVYMICTVGKLVKKWFLFGFRLFFRTGQNRLLEGKEKVHTKCIRIPLKVLWHINWKFECSCHRV